MLFLLELCDLMVEKIVEFVGLILIDEYLLLDEDLENNRIFLILYEINIKDESLFY